MAVLTFREEAFKKRLNLAKERGFPDCPLSGLFTCQAKHLHKPL